MGPSKVYRWEHHRLDACACISSTWASAPFGPRARWFCDANLDPKSLPSCCGGPTSGRRRAPLERVPPNEQRDPLVCKQISEQYSRASRLEHSTRRPCNSRQGSAAAVLVQRPSLGPVPPRTTIPVGSRKTGSKVCPIPGLPDALQFAQPSYWLTSSRRRLKVDAPDEPDGASLTTAWRDFARQEVKSALPLKVESWWNIGQEPGSSAR
jgi:hypothetical protein